MTSILAHVMLKSGVGLPVSVTWYSIQSPFFTPTETSAKATDNDAVKMSMVRRIARMADLCIVWSNCLMFCCF